MVSLLRTMVSVRSRKRRESEFPPTEEIPFPEEIHVDGGVSSLYPFLFFYC